MLKEENLRLNKDIDKIKEKMTEDFDYLDLKLKHVNQVIT